ncbi:MAG: class I SAM-dependent methyltransferase [Xanthomonadaceae bacterium]|nr:class I SAM-dependent methyltransferase [Xanthomonadaceae bacterium]
MIPGRPSATALIVALSVARRGAAAGLPDTSLRIATRALDAAGGHWRWLGRLARHRFGRALLDLVERIALPGLAAHHCARKRWLLDRLRATAPAGELLWPAVGFDGTGASLSETDPRWRVREYDHPDTLRLRAGIVGTHARLSRAPIELPDGIAYLREHGLDDRHAATLVAEGVAMYLPPRPLLRALRTLARWPAPPRLLLTALAPIAAQGRGFSADSGLVRRWLSAHGEPFLWRCPPPRLERLLQRHGYAIAARWEGDGYGEYAIDARHARAAFTAGA